MRASTAPEERQRLDPGSPWWTEHVARYRFAAGRARGGRVLDVACGTGYGLDHLAPTARLVAGVDIHETTARSARRYSRAPNVRTTVADARSLPFLDETFDLVVSFETLEHLHEREPFVRELARVLASDGLLVLSTPNARYTRPVNGKPANPFHVHEYTPEELHGELSRHFAGVSLLGQHLADRIRVSPFWDEQERLAAAGERASVVTWRALFHLPRPVGNRIARTLWGQPLLPEVEDYVFDAASTALAPVTLALCSKP